MTLQNKIFIFFLIIAGLSIMSYAFVQIDAASLKQYHTARAITANNGKRIYEIVFYAKLYTSQEKNQKSDMRLQAEKFNSELALLRNGGAYQYADEEIDLSPASGIYAEKLSQLEALWAKFYGFEKIINTERLMVASKAANSLDFLVEDALMVPNPEVVNALQNLINTSSELDDINEELLLLYTEGLNEEQVSFKLTILFLGVLNLIVVVIGYIIIIRNTVKPLKQLADIADLISEGHLVKSNNRVSNDEIGMLTKSINSLSGSLEKISDFATNVGQGNFGVDLEVRNSKDKLGHALLAMKDNLKNISEEDKKRNWANEGMAKFGEILRKNNEDIDELSYQIISHMVKYLKANQGGIFLINGEHHERFLELNAAYAYSKKKYLEKRVEIGQGLLGQCVLEEATIHLREIPQGYIDITSGLGESTPTSLLIVPLKVNDNVYGVIEIASFNTFPSYEIDFVERLSETVASTLANVRSTQTTKSLLEETQLYAEQLRAQEEEMRQNMEELAATQEEMGRVQIEMKNNEYNLNALINNTKDMIWAIGKDYHVMVFNRAFSEYHERKGILVKKRMSIFDTVDEEETSFWKKHYDRALGGEQFTLIENFKTFTFEDEYLAISFNPIYSPTDEVEGLSVFMKDVTMLNPIRLE